MPKRTRDYEKDLIERLQNGEFAVEYLNASLEDADDGGRGNREWQGKPSIGSAISRTTSQGRSLVGTSAHPILDKIYWFMET